MAKGIARLAVVALIGIAIGCGGTGQSGNSGGNAAARYHYQPQDGPYDYLIVAPDDAVAAVDEFAGFKQAQGFATVVQPVSGIDRTGQRDFPAAVRAYLQSQRDASRTQYVLIAGSDETIPMRYFYLTGSRDIQDEYTIPTDYYYGELDIDWDADGDGYYGEWGTDFDGDWDSATPWKKDLRVGRIPWDAPATIHAILSRTIDYELIPRADADVTTLLIGGSILYPDDAPTLMEFVKMGIDQDPFTGHIVTMYDPSTEIEHDIDLSHQNLLNAWHDLQPGFVMWASHGSWDAAYTSASGSAFIENDDTTTLRGVAPCVVISTGCTNAEPEHESLAFLALRDFAVAFIGSTRITHPGNYGEGAIATFPPGVAYLLVDNLPLGTAIDQAVDGYMTQLFPDGYDPELFLRNIFGFSLLGDPSLTFRAP